MSHNPQAPVLYDLCDRMGFLVMDESLRVGVHQQNFFALGCKANTQIFTGGAFSDTAFLIGDCNNRSFLCDNITPLSGQPTLHEKAQRVGVTETLPLAELKKYVEKVVAQKRTVHLFHLMLEFF